MVDKTQTKTKGSQDEGEQSLIGGPVPQSPPVDDLSQTPAEDPAATETVKPPKGAYIEDLTLNQVPEVGVNDPSLEPRQPAFSDEFSGKGGRFIIDPESGERKEVYEKYLDADGQEQYRKAL